MTAEVTLEIGKNVELKLECWELALIIVENKQKNGTDSYGPMRGP